MEAVGQWRAMAFGPAVTALMQLASAVGDTLGRVLLCLAACGWLLRKARKSDAVWLLAVVIGGTLLNLLLKQLFAAPRPELLPHLEVVTTYSFPSGHAAGNMIFLGALAMIAGSGRAWAGAGAIILLIGASRVWLGVHWPSDVLAGWVEGVGWLAICARLRLRCGGVG